MLEQANAIEFHDRHVEQLKMWEVFEIHLHDLTTVTLGYYFSVFVDDGGLESDLFHPTGPFVLGGGSVMACKPASE
jgi:hypothetical protein